MIVIIWKNSSERLYKVAKFAYQNKMLSESVAQWSHVRLVGAWSWSWVRFPALALAIFRQLLFLPKAADTDPFLNPSIVYEQLFNALR